MDKALFTVGVFAGILGQPSGKILLRRRNELGSIIPGQSFVGNWELPGGGVMEQEKVSYALLALELIREVIEELGIILSVDLMPFFYPVPFKGPKGYDLGLVTPVLVDDSLEIKDDILWVSPAELAQQAKAFVAPKKDPATLAQGLLSGYGKRMHCMALAILTHSPNPGYARQAREMLTELQASW